MVTCYHCRKTGHVSSKCAKKKKQDAERAKADQFWREMGFALAKAETEKAKLAREAAKVAQAARLRGFGFFGQGPKVPRKASLRSVSDAERAQLSVARTFRARMAKEAVAKMDRMHRLRLAKKKQTEWRREHAKRKQTEWRRNYAAAKQAAWIKKNSKWAETRKATVDVCEVIIKEAAEKPDYLAGILRDQGVKDSEMADWVFAVAKIRDILQGPGVINMDTFHNLLTPLQAHIYDRIFFGYSAMFTPVSKEQLGAIESLERRIEAGGGPSGAMVVHGESRKRSHRELWPADDVEEEGQPVHPRLDELVDQLGPD